MIFRQGTSGWRCFHSSSSRVGVRKVDHSSGSRSSNSPCEPRRSCGIEPATRSRNPAGQPFSSTGPVAMTGVTVTTTSTSATSTSTLRFSLPSLVVRAQVSTVLLRIFLMYSNGRGRSSESPHQFPDSRRLLTADAANARQPLFVGCYHTFDRAKFKQQTERQRRTYSGKALQDIQLARSETLWLAVVPFQTSVGRAELAREGQRGQRTLECMRMNLRHALWSRTLRRMIGR